MRIIEAGDRSISNYPCPSSITIGSFDGIHCAHQQIIRTVIKVGRDEKLLSGLVTFSPLPQVVIHRGFHFLLTTEEEKETLLSGLGLDFIYKIPFSRDLKAMSPELFFRTMVYEALRPRKVVVGPDHRFGRNREGDVELLHKLARELDFEVIMVPAYSFDGVPVSSTRIRELLLLGNVSRANSLLCRHYSFSATVVRGLKLGTQLGFPTINLVLTEKEKLLPADGVYAAAVFHKKKKFLGAFYSGVRPTIGEGKRTIEVYLFDFKGNLYGETVRVELVDRLRPDQKFKTTGALAEQIERDVKQAKEILAGR